MPPNCGKVRISVSFQLADVAIGYVDQCDACFFACDLELAAIALICRPNGKTIFQLFDDECGQIHFAAASLA